MPFTPKDWRNGPGGGTPIDAPALEDIEQRLATYADTKQAASQKGQANGYAGLDDTGRVPLTQLPPLGDGDGVETDPVASAALAALEALVATDAELAAAVATLTAGITAKQDSATAATDAELASAIATLNAVMATDTELASAVATLNTTLGLKQDALTAATQAELDAAVAAINAVIATDAELTSALSAHNASGAAHVDIRNELSALSDAVESSSGPLAVGAPDTNLGATPSLDLTDTPYVWALGMLNANATLSVEGFQEGHRLELFYVQDATGGRTLTLDDGSVPEVLTIPDAADALVHVRVDWITATQARVTTNAAAAASSEPGPRVFMDEDWVPPGAVWDVGSTDSYYQRRGDQIELSGKIVIADAGTLADVLAANAPLFVIPAEFTASPTVDDYFFTLAYSAASGNSPVGIEVAYGAADVYANTADYNNPPLTITGPVSFYVQPVRWNLASP